MYEREVWVLQKPKSESKSSKLSSKHTTTLIDLNFLSEQLKIEDNRTLAHLGWKTQILNSI